MTALATARELEFTAALVGAGFFLPSTAAGVWGRGAKLKRLLLDLSQYLSREFDAEQAETLAFPPILPRAVLDRVGYLEKFPQLLGSVCCFEGGAREHEALLTATRAGAAVISHLALADVALTPAACYPVYPALAGTLPGAGRVVDVEGWCYRQEPSESPTRLRSFQMRELVRAGTPREALAFRDRWVDLGLTLLRQLGLPAASAPASDPFFGSSGRLLTATQKEQYLKLELLVDVAGANPCAVMSANYHKDTFGELFAIRTQDGSVAHTACVGFGLERVALALLHHHGLDLTSWPAPVRQCLSPSL
jgi:seryl-tRNA synthetase